jgi:hypothetical protein
MMELREQDFYVVCTGDAAAGDLVLFEEVVRSGGGRGRLLGRRRIFAAVLAEDFDRRRRYQAFTLRVLRSDGVEPLPPGATIRRTAEAVYEHGTRRTVWPDERARKTRFGERHERRADLRLLHDLRHRLPAARGRSAACT